jgi:site-specific DNA recombinase
VSGKSTDRPQFQALLQAAQEGKVQRIVAMKLDRIARNVREFLATVDQLKEWQCDLVLVKESFDTSTPHGRFALTMFAAMAELEASTITERVMSGKQQKAKTGGTAKEKNYYNGSRIPLGYKYVGGAFQINEPAAAVVRDIFDGFIRGESMAAMANCLNTNETPTASTKFKEDGSIEKRGGQWYASTVRYILTNGLYAGIAQWHAEENKEDSKITAEGAYPAIISKATYEQALKRLQALRPGKQLETEIERRLQHA